MAQTTCPASFGPVFIITTFPGPVSIVPVCPRSRVLAHRLFVVAVCCGSAVVSSQDNQN